MIFLSSRDANDFCLEEKITPKAAVLFCYGTLTNLVSNSAILFWPSFPIDYMYQFLILPLNQLCHPADSLTNELNKSLTHPTGCLLV